jgi:hypothetical protein
MEIATWKYFVGACILTGGLALKFGAPVSAVGMGIVAVAFLNWRACRRVR